MSRVGAREDLARRLWNVLVIAVVVWIVTGAILIVTADYAGIDVFSTSSPTGWETWIGNIQFISYRVGLGSLGLLAGLWLSTRQLSKPD